jgi:hypothetical protein
MPPRYMPARGAMQWRAEKVPRGNPLTQYEQSGRALRSVKKTKKIEAPVANCARARTFSCIATKISYERILTQIEYSIFCQKQH